MIRVPIKVSSRYPVDRQRIRRNVMATLKHHGITDGVTVSVDIVGDRKMKQLNQQFLQQPTTTDVLSFPLAETSRPLSQEEKEFVQVDTDQSFLGDVVVSYPQARKQAQEHDLLVDEEIDRLVEHGVLHLLGIHHE